MIDSETSVSTFDAWILAEDYEFVQSASGTLTPMFFHISTQQRINSRLITWSLFLIPLDHIAVDAES